MPSHPTSNSVEAAAPVELDGKEKRRELLAFLFLAVVLAPMISIMIVLGYGFAVWLYQIIAGPPGPPGAFGF